MGKARARRAPPLSAAPPLVSLVASCCDAYRPEKALTVSEWADTYRVLAPDENEPGPWRTSRTPYLRDIMDALSSNNVIERVVFMGGTQIGKTECGNNWIGYVIHHAPGRMLAVQPTTQMARRNSKTRIENLINATRVLSDRVHPPRSTEATNTILEKDFPGGTLILTGANSAVGLRSMPARYLFIDEPDGYPGDVDGEGDPVALAEKRTITFKGKRKIFLTSTPGVKGFSRIERAFLFTDRRYYFVPCPTCGFMQSLKWSGVKWERGHPRDAWYECEDCSAKIPHHEKLTMLAAGQWRPTATCAPNAIGFHLSALYSPWASWGDIAEEFVQAGRDPALLKPFVNTNLAETWEDSGGEAIDADGIMARREEWGAGLPAEVGVITAGVDVQDDRIEVEIVGWGRDEESWSLDYRVIHGDPNTSLPWTILDELLQASPFKVDAACVDTGGHHTLAAYRFCGERAKRRVWAIRGASGKRPVWPPRASKANKGRVNLFTIGVDTAKETIYGRLRGVIEPGAGYCHFPMERDAHYFDQLTAERLRVKYVRGFAIQYWWKPEGKRNEALDARCYAYAALCGLLSMGLRLNVRVNQVVEARKAAAARGGGHDAPPSGTPGGPARRRVIPSSYMGA